MSKLDIIKDKLLKAKDALEKDDNAQMYHIHVNFHVEMHKSEKRFHKLPFK